MNMISSFNVILCPCARVLHIGVNVCMYVCSYNPISSERQWITTTGIYVFVTLNTVLVDTFYLHYSPFTER